MTQINYLDLFSGCGGFRYGLKMAGVALGYESHSDIDKHANSTYARHYKESEAIGDIKSIKPVRGKLNGHKINLITFGFPCQDLSVAGKGEGFSGDRSSLFYEATRLIRELRPEIFIFENVKGLFSNKEGRTFTDVLREIADIGLYECEWQLLNTRWFLPQNRERIYFIGHHGGQARRQVFPIGEEIEGSVEGAKQTAVNCLTAGGNSGRLHSSMSLILNKGRGFNKGGISKECGAITSSSFEQNNFVIPSTLRTHKVDGGFRPMSDGVCPTIPARARGDGSGQPCVMAISNPMREKKTQNGSRINEKHMFTLTTQDQHGVVECAKTIRCGGRGSYNSPKHNWDTYEVKGDIRRLTPIECERLHGFPDGYTDHLSDTQRYKQMGNTVSPVVTHEIFKRLYGEGVA